jgi:hypothetical protein
MYTHTAHALTCAHTYPPYTRSRAIHTLRAHDVVALTTHVADLMCVARSMVSEFYRPLSHSSTHNLGCQGNSEFDRTPTNPKTVLISYYLTIMCGRSAFPFAASFDTSVWASAIPTAPSLPLRLSVRVGLEKRREADLQEGERDGRRMLAAGGPSTKRGSGGVLLLLAARRLA